MKCKQCKRDVTTEDLALSGYTKQDGAKSHRNICKVCHNMNRYTANAIKSGYTEIVDKCMLGYKQLVSTVYMDNVNLVSLPASIAQAYRSKFKVSEAIPLPAITPYNAFMDMVTQGGYTEACVAASYEDLALKYQLTLCDDMAHIILEKFLRVMSTVTTDLHLEHAIDMLYASSVIPNTSTVALESKVNTARTDIMFPEVFLNELFDASENIFDEEVFTFFGVELNPTSKKFWKEQYAKLNEICGIRAISY